MGCNCNNTSGNGETNENFVIPHVYGNVLRLGIPLTLRTIEIVNNKIEHTDTDFIPSSDYPVNVVFSKGNIRITLLATMRNGNVAYVEDKGTIPVGKYDITITCNDDNGNPYRFNQKTTLDVVDATIDAGIEKPIEYEVGTWYLDASIFIALKGENGLGIADITTESSGEVGGINTITITLTDGTTRTFTILNGSGSVDNALNINSLHPVSNSVITNKFNSVDETISTLFHSVNYNSNKKNIVFYNKDRVVIAELDARPFIKDGMVNNVYISNGTLVITFNTDAGREAIAISLQGIFNPNNYYNVTQVNNLLGNYYTKTQVDNGLANKADVDRGKIFYRNAPSVVFDNMTGDYEGQGPMVFYDPSMGGILHLENGTLIPRGLPKSDLIYYDRDTEAFYLYDESDGMVEIETGPGGINATYDSTHERLVFAEGNAVVSGERLIINI